MWRGTVGDNKNSVSAASTHFISASCGSTWFFRANSLPPWDEGSELPFLMWSQPSAGVAHHYCTQQWPTCCSTALALMCCLSISPALAVCSWWPFAFIWKQEHQIEEPYFLSECSGSYEVTPSPSQPFLLQRILPVAPDSIGKAWCSPPTAIE